ncbi:MAG: hypothetical protein OXG25_14965 [Gammaproteobacteria bacterium]|nr:hypothetical protein [Gammaproteobacteria bacterium]
MRKKWVKVMMRILAHVLALAALYIAFSFSLFLGLQVRPMYGNAGIITVIGLVVLYVYFGWIKSIAKAKSRK